MKKQEELRMFQNMAKWGGALFIICLTLGFAMRTDVGCTIPGWIVALWCLGVVCSGGVALAGLNILAIHKILERQLANPPDKDERK